VEVAVADEGVGIDPDQLPKVFERFYQVDPSTTRRHGGLGIGLSIAKSLTEMHGGTIRVESPGRGRGTRFHLSFPAREPLASAPLSPEAREGMGLAGVRILLADDEADTLEALNYLLVLEGATVRTAESGRETLGLASEERPDVILCDLEMPDIEGYDVAARLRSEPRTADVRLIALSGHGADADLERTKAAGFDAHLLKPVEPETMVTVIREVLGLGTGQSV
jgi:CheY-like chemotaxis protein